MHDREDKYHQILKSISRYVSIDQKLFLESQKQKPSVSIKLNANKINNLECLDFELSDKVSWAEDAYYLNTKPAFYLDPLFYAGGYYVMDSASMFLEYILKQIEVSDKSIILDISAAPGGKSVLISNYLSEEGLLWSNEINYSRAKILSYNLSKWGKSNYLVTNNDSETFRMLENIFDIVVCDLPCTGSGLFRKYPEWINSFNETLIQQCVHRQKQILKNIFSSVKENGYIVYSTCSFMSEENEDISQFIIQNGFEYRDIILPEKSGIVKTEFGLRFFPHLTKSEGFFYAVFQKKENIQSKHRYTQKTFKQHSSKVLEITNNFNTVPFSEYIEFQVFHKVYHWQSRFYLSNQKLGNYLLSFNYSLPLNYIDLGTTISDSKTRIPAPELATSLHLKKQVPKINLSKSDAQKFLKKEMLKISAEKSIHLMAYHELGMGWAKVLENRVNNYFPTEWRIFKEIDVVQ